MHHIIPKHRFRDLPEEIAYCNSKENLIHLSLVNHVKAHELLYELYNLFADKAAVLMLQGNKVESRRIWRQLGAEAVHKKLKADKANFWNLEFQKEMGKRSLARPDALEIRSKGGRKGGRVRNLDRAIGKNDRYVFFFEKVAVMCIFNCQTGGDVLLELNKFKQTSLKRTSPLLNGSRKTLNGWSCEKLE